MFIYLFLLFLGILHVVITLNKHDKCLKADHLNPCMWVGGSGTMFN